MHLSVPQQALLDELNGKHVALIGNARALAEGQQGAEIDAHDLVIRINRAPMPAAASHGTRTDWLALGIGLPPEDRARLAPRRTLYMAAKRKRLDWATATSPGFYLHPRYQIEGLARALRAKPTTGAMLIELCLRAELKTLDLYGFDFFASRSLSGRRSAEDVPHDFGAEAAWVAARAEADPRLSLR
ncbi:hypothetical protein DRW48_05940 [Paracoccus suum]|uniref:Glycosyltransferase family 29 (Sialyltransferase) n=2 Tax=Paracoccus suum TaxID=2259340 RepID=A0A344PP04_9RHOB|nr:hypothetical protein DRW48_05940 [Paracoccus suum]